MRILTLNLFGHHRGWSVRRLVVTDGLRRLEPDVVVFQEAVVREDHDQVAEILGTEHEVHHQPGRSEDGSGASIASRWKMRVVRQADLHVTDAGDRTGWIGSLTIVEVDAPAPIGPLLVVHHKPTWQSGAEAERERQAVRSARIVEDLLAGADRHVVLAGDFDATPDAASIRFWTGRQSLEGTSVSYQDAWEAIHGDEPGHTFTPANGLRSGRWRPRPGRRIDYVMVRCGDHGSTLDVVGCERVFDRAVDGVWASDHFGVWADLEPVPWSDDPP